MARSIAVRPFVGSPPCDGGFEPDTRCAPSVRRLTPSARARAVQIRIDRRDFRIRIVVAKRRGTRATALMWRRGRRARHPGAAPVGVMPVARMPATIDSLRTHVAVNHLAQRAAPPYCKQRNRGYTLWYPPTLRAHDYGVSASRRSDCAFPFGTTHCLASSPERVGPSLARSQAREPSDSCAWETLVAVACGQRLHGAADRTADRDWHTQPRHRGEE